MTTISLFDSDKTHNNSIDDYTTLEHYNYSFFNMPKNSYLRYALVPGNEKRFNIHFDQKFPVYTDVHTGKVSPGYNMCNSYPKLRVADQRVVPSNNYDYTSYPPIRK